MTKKEEETTASSGETKATSSFSTRKTGRGGGGRSSPRQQQQQQQQQTRERPPTPAVLSATTTTTGGATVAAAPAAAAGGVTNTGGSGPGGGTSVSSASAPPLPVPTTTSSTTTSSSFSRQRGRGSERDRSDRDRDRQGRYHHNRRSSTTGRQQRRGARGGGGRRRSDGSGIDHQDPNKITDTSEEDTFDAGSGTLGKGGEAKQQQQQQSNEDRVSHIQVLQSKVDQTEQQNKLLQGQLEQHIKTTKTEAERLRAELQSEKNRCSRLNDELTASKEETLAVISSKTVLSNRVHELERQLTIGAAAGGGGGRGGSRSGSWSQSHRTDRVIDLERQLEEALRTISNLRLQQSHQQSSPSTLSSSGNGGGDNGSKDGAGSKGSNNSNTQQSILNRSGENSSSTVGASERLDRAHQQIVILEAERKAEQERSRQLEQRLADLQSNFDRLSYDQQGRGGYEEGATPAGKGRDQYPSGGARRSVLKNQDSPPPITGEQLIELQAAFDRQAQIKPKTTIENPLHQGTESGTSTRADNQVDPRIDQNVQGFKGDSVTDTQTFSKQGAGLPRVEHGQATTQGNRDETATKEGDETPFCVLLKGIPPSTTPADVHKFLILHGVTDISYIKLADVDYAPEVQGQGNVFIITDKGCLKALSLTGMEMQKGYSLHVSPANTRTQSLFDGQAAPATLPHPYVQPMAAKRTRDQQGEPSQLIRQDPEDTGHGGPLETYCIYFRGAPFNKTPEEIYDFFVSHGVTDMQSFEVNQDDRTGRTLGDGYFYVKTKEVHANVLSLHKKIFLGNRYIELFNGTNRPSSSSRSWLGWTDDGGRGGRSGGPYVNRRDRYSSGNRRTNTNRSMQPTGGFYNPPTYSTGGQGLAPNHPQSHYDGNRYGNPQSHHPQSYGQHLQEYHHHHQQHIHFQHLDGFQGMHPPAAPMYGFVAPGYDIHGGPTVYPSPQFNPDTAAGGGGVVGGGWHGGEMGGNIGGGGAPPPQDAAQFPTLDLGMSASAASQYQHPQYPVQENIGGPTFHQPPLVEMGVDANSPAPGLLDDDDDDDDPPDLVNEDSLPAFDQKDDMSYPNIGPGTTPIGTGPTDGSTDSATEDLHDRPA